MLTSDDEDATGTSPTPDAAGAMRAGQKGEERFPEDASDMLALSQDISSFVRPVTAPEGERRRGTALSPLHHDGKEGRAGEPLARSSRCICDKVAFGACN
jgi:hypothetical protein